MIPLGLAPGFNQSNRVLDLSRLPDATVVAHYRADDYTAGSWPDRSGNGYTLTQVTGSAQPTAIADGGSDFGNRPIVRFDGGDYVQRASTPVLTQPNTALIISKLTVNAAFDQVVLSEHSGSVSRVFATSSELPRLNSGSAITGTTNLLNVVTVQEYLSNGASSRIYIDGTSEAAADAGSNGRTGLIVGTIPGAGSNFWGGDIAEILIASTAFTAAARAYYQLYCTQHYGVTF